MEEYTREEEFEIIYRMLTKAKREGLEVEVLHFFADELRSGEKDLKKASYHALYEWDIV